MNFLDLPAPIAFNLPQGKSNQSIFIKVLFNLASRLLLSCSLPLSCSLSPLRATCATRKTWRRIANFCASPTKLAPWCNWRCETVEDRAPKCQSETNEPATVSSVCTARATAAAVTAGRRRSRTSQFYSCKVVNVLTGSKNCHTARFSDTALIVRFWIANCCILSSCALYLSVCTCVCNLHFMMTDFISKQIAMSTLRCIFVNQISADKCGFANK